MSFAIEPGSKVLFTGDSITDNGRRGDKAPLGGGYVKMAHDLILAKYPDHGLTVLNTGISGNTVRDLHGRWTDDVIQHQPDWLSIMIGINDVHRWMAKVEGQSVSPEEYVDYYRQILDRTLAETSAKVVLIEPFYISRDNHPGTHRTRVLENLTQYRDTVQTLATEYKFPYVRFHQLFQKLLTRYAPDDFAPEPVHPHASGHLVMAHEWLRTLDF